MLGENCFVETQIVDQNLNYDFNFQQFVHFPRDITIMRVNKLVNYHYLCSKMMYDHYLQTYNRVILSFWSAFTKVQEQEGLALQWYVCMCI